MEQGASIEDYIAILKRRWLLLVTPAVLGLVIAGLIAVSLPERFRSTARILVESQSIPEELARTTVTSGPVERLRVIEQRLMTRQTLLDIADRFDVFRGGRMTPNDVVLRMRDATTFASVPLATQGRNQVTATAIDISFTADRAEVASRVANEFVTLLLQENLRTRGESASDTLGFFNSEVERLGNELSSIEERIKIFKIENEGALPESLDFRRGELLTLQSRALERERRKAVLMSDRQSVEAALQAGVAPGAMLSPQEQELQRLRQTLEQSRAIYAPTHPTIRTLQGRIAALEAAVGTAQPSESADAQTAPSPVGAMADLRRRIDAIDQEMRILDEQDQRDEARIREIEESIGRTPEVELVLSALQRQQISLQTQYQDAVLKRSQAETGERLEVNRAAERFEIVEQAQTPQRPESPNRPLIAAAGFAGGGALGFALMVLIELTNQRIRSPRDLERRFGLRPIMTVPYIRTGREVYLRRLASRATVFAALILAPAAIYAFDRYVTPIPLVAQTIGERLGIEALSRGMVGG